MSIRSKAYHLVHCRLIAAAQDRTKVFYAAVEGDIESMAEDLDTAPEVGDLLQQINEDEHRAGRPLLAALVITGKAVPGNAFFDSARDLGVLTSTNAEEEMRFWAAEEARVYDAWAPVR